MPRYAARPSETSESMGDLQEHLSWLDGQVLVRQQNVDAALLAGDDTRQLRADLADASGERDEVAVALQRVADAEHSRVAEQIAVKADAIAVASDSACRILLAELTPPPLSLGAPMTEAPSPAVAAAAAALAAAQAARTATHVAVEAASADERAARDRLDALDGRRASIITRRAIGQHEDGDGAALALVDADVRGLEAILTTRMRKTGETQQADMAASSLVEIAKAALSRMADAELEAALVAHADGLDRRMLECVGELQAVRQRLGGGRAAWHPSTPTWMALRMLQSLHGAL